MQSWTLAVFILIVTISLNLAVSTAFVAFRPKSFTSSICYGFHEDYLQVLQDYHKPMQLAQIMPPYAINLIFTLAFLVHVFEATIYLSLWKYLYQHNKNMAPYISQQAMKHRMRRSAVSLGCEMYIFTFQTFATVLMGLVSQYGSARLYHLLFMAYQFTFPLKNSIQAMSTETTRRIYLYNLSWGMDMIATSFSVFSMLWKGVINSIK